MVALVGPPGNGPTPVISTLVRVRSPSCRSLSSCFMMVTQRLRAMVGGPHQLHPLAGPPEPVCCGRPPHPRALPCACRKDNPPDKASHTKIALPPTTRATRARSCYHGRLPWRSGGVASIAAHNEIAGTGRVSFAGASSALLWPRPTRKRTCALAGRTTVTTSASTEAKLLSQPLGLIDVSDPAL